MLTGRPWVTLKLGASLDGRTALANGTSKWITGDKARADVQRLRARASAIITGSGTVLADDPMLTVRDPDLDLRGRRPLRVVLDSHLRTPTTAQVLCFAGSTLILTRDASSSLAEPLRSAGARVEEVRAAPEGLDLEAVLDRLGALECNEVLVEAGPTLAGDFVRAGWSTRSSSTWRRSCSGTRPAACSTCRSSSACATAANSSGGTSSASATTCA